MDIREQIEELKAIYDEACYPTHTTISQEPEYTCEYCNYRDVAPGHTEECLVVPCKLAANTMEAMLEVVEAAESVSIANDAQHMQNMMYGLRQALANLKGEGE